METLPPEALIKIFNYLPDIDLERAATVCKRWKKVIINSPEILNHVCRCISRGTLDSRKMTFKLPYKNLLIECANFKIYLPLSSDFSLLRQLTILATPIEFKNVIECLQFPMPHLKTLTLDCESEDFLSIIYCENVEHFHFRYDHYGKNPFDETLKQFFSLNSNLKRLHFEICFPSFNMSRYKFKLQSLIIDDVYDLPSRFIKFLKAQENSLKELVLRVFKVDEPVLHYIYFGMHLTKLLDNHWNRVELERKCNQSIKNLAISNSMLTPRDVSLIQQFILRCHALDFLRIELSPLRPRQTLQFLSSLMPRLKTVALSLKRMKHLKLIKNWIRSNGYHVSLSSTWPSVAETILKKGFYSEREWSTANDMIFFISSEKSASNFHQFGEVIRMNAFYQISQDNPGGTVVFKNLTRHKQDKKVRKSLQIRIFIEHLIVPSYDDEKNVTYLKFSDDFDDYEDEIDD